MTRPIFARGMGTSPAGPAGPAGAAGPAGPAGANGGTDASTADNVTSGTATKAALSSAYAPKAATYASGVAYVVGQLVVSGTTLYRVTTAHTSSGAIDLSKFAAAGGGTSGAVNQLGLYLPSGWDAKWQAALANASTTPAIVAGVGDSVMRGFYSSKLDGTTATSWFGRLRTNIQTTYGDGGVGFIDLTDETFFAGTASPSGYLAASRATRNGGSFGTGLKSGPGLADTTVLSDSSASVTVTGVRGTIIDIYHLTAGGLGSFTYAIDGAAAVTVNTSGGNGTAKVTVTGLSAGTHTVVLTGVASTAVHICGVRGRNSTGVIFDQFSAGGYASNAVTTNNAYGSIAAWSGGKSNPSDLYFYGMHLNDEATNTTGDTFAAQVASTMKDVRETATGGPSVLFVLNHQGPNWTGNTKAQDYGARLASLAETYGCGFISLPARFRGSWAYAQAKSFWSTGSGNSGNAGTDQGHPGDIGHALIEAQIRAIITGTVPALP